MHKISALGSIEMTNVVFDAPFILKFVTRSVGNDRFPVLVLGRLLRAQVSERDPQALIEERHLLKASTQRGVVKLDGLENLGARPEGDCGSALITLLALGEWSIGNTVCE